MKKYMIFFHYLVFIMLTIHDVYAKDLAWRTVENLEQTAAFSSVVSQTGQVIQPLLHRASKQPPTHVLHSPSLHIYVQAPRYMTSTQNTYTWVNGDPATAKIETSSYDIITQWKELGLPAPPKGMFWIFENGRYMLVAKRQ